MQTLVFPLFSWTQVKRSSQLSVITLSVSLGVSRYGPGYLICKPSSVWTPRLVWTPMMLRLRSFMAHPVSHRVEQCCIAWAPIMQSPSRCICTHTPLQQSCLTCNVFVCCLKVICVVMPSFVMLENIRTLLLSQFPCAANRM